MSIRRLIMALVFVAVTIHSCGSGGDKTPLGSADDGPPNAAPADAGQSISGFSVADELSPWGANSPFEGSKLELDTFPNLGFQTGGTKDSIPALSNPTFVGAVEIDYVLDDDLVLGLVIDGIARAYPENIGWWHEIVNDNVGGVPVIVTLCPLTGTGMVFNGVGSDGGRIKLGVSGLLFNNNLIMYDRRDQETLYPQMVYKGVVGPRQGEALELLPVIETTWKQWKRFYPDTKVVDGNTGVYRIGQYTNYPYVDGFQGDYRAANEYILFPQETTPTSQMFGAKDLAMGVRFGEIAKAYPFQAMHEQDVANDEVNRNNIVVVHVRNEQLAIPYSRDVLVDGKTTTLTFEKTASSNSEVHPFMMKDKETETTWNLLGKAIAGPLSGQQLKQLPSHNGFWFAWGTFWQNIGIH